MLAQRFTRRQALGAMLAASPLSGQDTGAAVEAAHREMWRRFVDPKWGTVYDYAGLNGEVLLPGPEECAASKPNALSWWTPIENGAFFGGLYLDILCRRWKLKRDPETAGRARRIAAGLMRLSQVGRTPGFIARGVAADGKSHYIAGSDDQTFPWFFGLWSFCRSGIPATAERRDTIRTMEDAARALDRNGWRMPCDREGFGDRGTWMEPNFIHSARLLFVTRAMHDLTRDSRWLDLYHKFLPERLAWCEAGARYEGPGSKDRYPINPPFWTSASSQAGMRALMELETDAEVRKVFAKGLRANAEGASLHLGRYRQFDASDQSVFQADWRFLNDLWTPQPDIKTAVDLATRQVREWHRRSPRRVYEANHMREPIWAAWIVVLSADRELIQDARQELHRMIGHYRWDTLYTSLFFPVEAIGYELAR